MTPRAFIIGFLAYSLGLFLAYFVCFHLLLGAPISAEYWLSGTKRVKLKLADEIKTPKILFVGGSSSLFGNDAATISQEIDTPVVNLALHAGLPLSYHLGVARQALRPGDTVIVFPEYGYYSQEQSNTAWFIQQVFAWDEEYFRTASLRDRIDFVTDTPLQLVRNAAVAQIFRREILERLPDRAAVSDADVMAIYTAGWNSSRASGVPNRRAFQYFYNNLNNHGDILHTDGADFPEPQDYGLTKPFSPTPSVWKTLLEFQRYCSSNDVRLYLGFAPIMNSGEVLEKREVVQANLAGLRQAARDHGIDFIEAPDAAFFEPELFFDTNFHLNIRGKQIRSSHLAVQISKVE